MKALYILKVIGLFILKLVAKLLLKVAEFVFDMIRYIIVIIRVILGKVMRIAGGIGAIICVAAIWYFKQFRIDMIPFTVVTLMLLFGVEIFDMIEIALIHISIALGDTARNIRMGVA